MQEAIDYNALSWVRQELAATLKQARHHLEEYAGNKSRESLQGCVAHLHEARGPLQMVNLKSADLLTGEMEEVLADLLLDSIDQPETALELLMQGFLELPEYLYSLRAGRSDRLDVLFPLVNSLRATRDEQPLEEDAIFSPDLSVRVPDSVFDVRAEHPQQDVTALARAARIRFQGGLLEWYRNGDNGNGLQPLVDILDHLRQNAASEPVARLWWVAGGIAELLQHGALEVTPGIKRLFSQIDRHIKRLMDQGEAVFSDVLTDDLLKNLLFHIYKVNGSSPRIASIRSTYGLGKPPEHFTSADDSDAALPTCSEELLQTVSGTAREDMVRIKEQLDDYLKGDHANTEVLASVADELHALGNMLGMIGMDRLGAIVADNEQFLRECATGTRQASDDDFAEMANTMVSIEDALADISASIENQQAGSDGDDVTFRQGQDAIIVAVMDDMASAKESINEFLRSCGDFDLLVDVPVILNRIHGGLQMAGQERIATVTSMVRTFIDRELVAGHRELSEEDLDRLADAICSIEYCVEELVENRDYGSRAMKIAEDSLEKLGYAVPEIESQEQQRETEQESVESPAVEVTSQLLAGKAADETSRSSGTGDGNDDITALQVINSQGDPEIIEIFNEEAAEELEKISKLIPAWCDDPVNEDALTEIRRSLHTMKGSGRMVGAMATGQFSWSVENLVNHLLDGRVEVSEDVVNLLRQVPAALSALVEQVKDSGTTLPGDVNDLVRQANALSKPGATAHATAATAPLAESSASPVDDTAYTGDSRVAEPAVEAALPPGVEQMPVVIAANFPVLDAGADEEIVDIFLEEATEEFDKISISVPAWITQPENTDLIAELQRSFHTMKGSGRMAGAMRIGEFCWMVELVFTRLTDGIIEQSASLFRFMGRVPETLSQMLDQVRNGIEPEVDVQEMMQQATVLANGGQVVASSVVEQDEAGVETADYDVTEEEPSLPEIFTIECREHLRLLNEWVELFEAPGYVSDSLYRALHTLSGISESAEMMSISRLADGLYAWFGALYEERKAVGTIGYEVLRDCAWEISRMVDALPETIDDETVLDVLCTRIGALPPVENQPPAVITPEPVGEDASGPDGTAEVVIIQPVELWDADAEVEPVAEELSFTDDRITDIAEAVVEPVEEPGTEDEYVDGLAAEAVAVAAADEQESPEDAGEPAIADDATEVATTDTETLEYAEPETPVEPVEVVASPQDDPYAEVEPALFDIFVEEATEIMDASEATLRGWSDEPDDRGLMAEFQRQLHTLKGGARMVDLANIGNLSHAVESLMTEIAEDRVQLSPDLFGLLDDSHDRLADMLDLVKNRQPVPPASELETVLQAISNGDELPITVAGTATATEPDTTSVVEEMPSAVVEADDTIPVELSSETESVEPVDSALTEPSPAVEASMPAAMADEEAAPVEVPAETESVEPVDSALTEPSTAVETDAAAAMADEEGVPVEVQPEAESVLLVEDTPEEDHPAPVRPRGRKVAPPRLVIDREQQTKTRGEQVKVQSDALDNMVNHAGEINIFRARMEKQISDYRFNLAELDQTIKRLRDQLRKLEMENEAQILYRYEQESDARNQDFDPLELDRYSNLQQLSRALMESISDLRSLQELMENTTRESETLLLQQSRVSTELQDNLIRTRMIPFVSLSPRLRRIARQSARQLDKKVEVNLLGEDGEMDRAVLERIIAPLEHMLRNSVAHGIEVPQVRKESGKPVSGKIDIEFERDGSEIVLRITDDGAGMDIDAIRSRAIERELISQGASLSDDDVIQFVLQTGFSTASEVTQISGRGVGLDVVNSEVKQLGGSLHIESAPGQGTTFIVRLPYTLAINQGMLVTAGDETFCVPLASVEGVVRFYPEELRDCYGDGQQLFEYGGNEYRLKHLGSLLETGGMIMPGEREQVPVLLVRAGEKRIGFHVESLQGIREVVIKPVGPQLSLVDSISGATILGDGRVVMILDMVAVSRREASVQTATGTARSAQSDDELVVMVVDDSITVRKVTARLLERNGYKVVTAKDGVDAMGMLQESVPDIMLLDIEMPRMDGFELATHMRNDDNLRHVPIIMITSRTGDKHRERAKQIGVQHYLGKPYQESDLLNSIHEIIGVTEVITAT
ncbi:MAG: Hpt domain-containing protein [Gammaproteobacteria bacterium]